MKRKRKKIMFITLSILAGAIIFITLYINFHPVFGGKARGETRVRMQKSPHFAGGKFQNLEETPVMAEGYSMIKAMREWIKGPENGKPDSVITQKFDKEAFLKADSGIHVTWFGHSTVLLNIDGTIVLIDPVFNGYASPLPNSNKSFTYTHNMQVEDLPPVDVLVISHDHYDHLDYPTIKKLTQKVSRFYVPLGVDAHLVRWGVDPSKIIMADWWDEFTDASGLTFAATPARHFSGRGFTRNQTLWCSWVIKSKTGSIYFGGDSGYGRHFKEIGEKYGLFDLTMIECGQYNEGWPYIHAMPEESVQAHIDLQGKYMLPIHWGKFQLSLHPWTEPIDRAREASKLKGVNLLELQVGEMHEVKSLIFAGG